MLSDTTLDGRNRRAYDEPAWSRRGGGVRRVRIGVIGTGRIGRLHATNLVRRVDAADVVAVADPLISVAHPWLDELGVSERTTDFRSLLSRAEIDAVFVCAPTDLHADLVRESASAGKHIFCEKPIDLSIARARSAIDAVRTAGVTMQVGFNRRFDHNFSSVQRQVADGGIGEVHLVKITSRDPQIASPEYLRRSGGIFLDMLIHDFDMAEFLSGSRIVRVHAAGAVLVNQEIREFHDVDTTVVTLWFENGALGVIDASRQAVYGYDQRVEVFGSAGMLVAENETTNTVRRLSADGEIRSKPRWFFLERYQESFVAEARAFVNALIEGSRPLVGPEEGLRPLVAAAAAARSLAEGGPVDMEEVAD